MLWGNIHRYTQVESKAQSFLEYTLEGVHGDCQNAETVNEEEYVPKEHTSLRYTCLLPLSSLQVDLGLKTPWNY